MNWTSLFVAFVLIIATASGDGDDEAAINNLLNPDRLPEIPGIDVGKFNLSQAPTVEDAERLFKEKCLKNADLEAFNKAQTAKDTVKNCIFSLVNVTVLMQEIENERETGNLDVVFRKYCRKTPTLRQCVSNFTSTMEPCLDVAERESKHIVQNITDSLVEFICYKEGDRIALFIAEGGPECLTEHQQGMQQCVNETFSKHIPGSVPSVDNLPSLVLGVEECHDLRALQKCVVTKLEACKEPTPANIVESMFNFIYKVTPCSKLAPRAASGRTGSGVDNVAPFVSLLLAASLLLKLT